MQADLYLKREKKNELEYGRVHSPNVHLHFHSQIEIYVVLSGEIETIINGHRRLLHGGEISAALSYDAHSYNTPKAAEAEYLIIPTTYCSDILPLLENKHFASPFIDDPNIFNVVCEAMNQILSGSNELLERGYIYVILGAILDRMVSDGTHYTGNDRMNPDILIYISDKFRDNISLTSLAKHFGYNPSYLSRSFHSTFGISFGKYLTLTRLREAVMLMRKGDMSITECALESGFSSTRSFYRAFSDEFGCPPKEYLSKL